MCVLACAQVYVWFWGVCWLSHSADHVSTFPWKILPDLNRIFLIQQFVLRTLCRITVLTSAFGNYFLSSTVARKHTSELMVFIYLFLKCGYMDSFERRKLNYY